MYKLFLDDIRDPKDGYTDWIIVRNVKSAKNIILHYNSNCPQEVSLDHDLGDNQDNGYDFVKWFCNLDIERKGKFIPDNIIFKVHSMNPVGKDNMEVYFKSYMKNRNNSI